MGSFLTWAVSLSEVETRPECKHRATLLSFKGHLGCLLGFEDFEKKGAINI